MDDDKTRLDARIVELYEAGMPVVEIKLVVGSTSIYPVLRRAGLGPQRYLRSNTDSNNPVTADGTES